MNNIVELKREIKSIDFSQVLDKMGFVKEYKRLISDCAEIGEEFNI